MKQSQCNAGGRHCARERGAWQPVPRVPEFRSALKQFVEQCCVIEAGSRVGAGDLYRAYERWAVANGKRRVMEQRNFEARMIMAGVEMERERLGGGDFWAGLRVKQGDNQSSVPGGFWRRHAEAGRARRLCSEPGENLTENL